MLSRATSATIRMQLSLEHRRAVNHSMWRTLPNVLVHCAPGSLPTTQLQRVSQPWRYLLLCRSTKSVDVRRSRFDWVSGHMHFFRHALTSTSISNAGGQNLNNLKPWLCYVTVCYAMLCYFMSRYVMLCYVTLSYLFLCYLMLRLLSASCCIYLVSWYMYSKAGVWICVPFLADLAWETKCGVFNKMFRHRFERSTSIARSSKDNRNFPRDVWAVEHISDFLHALI